VHPGRDRRAPVEIVDILGEAGADLTRCVICHMDRTYPEGDGPADLAARGVCVEWDFFGIETSHYWMDPDVELPTDRGRLRAIRSMIEQGWGDRVLISQDICTATRTRSLGGHGYGHIFRNVVPLMRRMGFAEAEIVALTRDNPLRLLAIPERGRA
jgi:phosphotriesterase-related protein